MGGPPTSARILRGYGPLLAFAVLFCLMDTFEAGLNAYPGGTGPAGTWRFGAGRHTPVQDAREIYWDRNRTSTLNDKQGAYVETEPGRRFRPGEWPASDPAVFRGSAG